jgi:hypothetical protein
VCGEIGNIRRSSSQHNHDGPVPRLCEVRDVMFADDKGGEDYCQGKETEPMPPMQVERNEITQIATENACQGYGGPVPCANRGHVRVPHWWNDGSPIQMWCRFAHNLFIHGLLIYDFASRTLPFIN